MWFYYAIATVILWGFADLFYKKGNTSEEKYTHLKTLFMVGIVLGFQALLVLAKGYQFDYTKIIKYLPVTSMYILSMALGYFGLRYLQLSISSPIQNSSGAVAAIMTFLIMGQRMNTNQFIAVLMISLGIILLTVLEKKADEELQNELKTANKKSISSWQAIIFPVLYMVIDSIGTFLDGYYLEGDTPILTEQDSIIAYGFTFFIVGLVSIIYLVVIKKEKFNIFEEKNRGIAAIFEGVGQYTYVYALAANAILSEPTVSAYCLVSVILGKFILKEKLSRTQYLIIAMMLIAIVMLGMEG